ncbi:unnamed protein product [Schistocephalus solidus]|uniref:Elongator complex protein 6 n=1 Tax=Schistocephalus solidus TaxID=70667 RepID=A0A183TKQ7_SCHSO|nr:unnamed protein product [Schistocephalus solidus]
MPIFMASTLPTLDNLDTFLRFCNSDDGLQVQLMIEAGSDGFASLLMDYAVIFYIQDTFQNFWVLTLWKLSSVLMAFMNSESCAGLHDEGNIAGSADLNRLISQLTANSRSPIYLLVRNTGSVKLNGEVLHQAPVLTRPFPEL